MKRSFAPLLTVAALATPVAPAAAKPHRMSEPRTAAAVRAADDAWGAAEVRGDAEFVDQLLLPDYRSVGPTGKATERAVIIAGARANRSNVAAAAARANEWKAAHPTRAEVTLHGNTAVLTWVSTSPATAGRISSSDVFTYRDGRWHAAYSQHANLG
ncbi:nuclear transport factor 2 family protein [Sphingomonas sp. ASV193]|uniref:nuclear transport factor 2 family protein n=1 Tax=Sphingomonas sp. ASV193 TaxID=3144405 RepID=UPI0032E8B4D0